jgi:uncharacterized protein
VCRGNYDWLKDYGIDYVLTDGPAEGWYSNGQMIEQLNYVNGKLHGKCTWWYVTGQICEHSNYVNGKLHGECTWWYISGQMREQSTYINGVKQP